MITNDRKVTLSFLTFLVALLAFPSVVSGQILLLNPAESHEVKYSKLEIDARQLGSSIRKSQIYRSYDVDNKDALIYFATHSAVDAEHYRKAILRTSSFVEGGGRAIIFVSEGTLRGENGEKQVSDFIADEFGVAVTKKDASVTGKVPSSIVSDFSFSDGEIGCSSYSYSGKYNERQVGCEMSPVHLVPIEKSGIVKTKSFEADSKDINMYVEKEHGNGRVIIMGGLSDDDGSPINSFFNDNNYSLFENGKVAKGMVGWLLGEG